MGDSKKCQRCKTTKPLTEFSRNKHSEDDANRICRACNTALYAAYKEAHPEMEKARMSKYRSEHTEKIKANQRLAYAKKNPRVEFKREARKFRADQLTEAIEFAEANPGSSRKAIMEEAGLTQYLWQQIRPLFTRTIVKHEKLPQVVAYTRNSETFDPS